MLNQMVREAPIDMVGQPEPAPEPPKPAPFKMPKPEFRQGIFDPAIANAAQQMFANKKQGQLPRAQGFDNGMTPPSFNPNNGGRGGRPGGAP